MRTPSAIVSAAVLSGAVWCAAAPADDAPSARLTGIDAVSIDAPVVYATAAAPQSDFGHCSVVGAVQYPATFRSAGGTVLLQTLLEQAGGLTGESSGIVRILHDGRQQLINLALSTGSDVVPQGSVIVADRTAASPGEREFVDVACIHLCDRPVVLCLKPANATLPRLLDLLGQPPEVSTAVRVVLPSGHSARANGALPSGTVVLFDPTTLDQPALAGALSRSPLNDLVELESVEHQQVAAAAVTQLESLEQYLMSRNATPTADPAPAPAPPTLPLTSPLPGTTPTPPSLPQTLAAPEPVDESAADTLPVRPVSALQLQSISGPVRPPDEEFTAEDYLRAKQRAAASRAAEGSEAAADEIVSATADEVQSRWLHIGSSIAAWLLCAFAAYGAFGIWMRQHGRRRETLRNAAAIELARPAPVVETRSPLSQLIENSLPLREEETAVPSQTFHGRTVGFRYLIRSGPHPLQGPHFAAARVQSRPQPAGATAVRPPAAPPAAVRDRHERTINRFDRAVEAQRAPTAARVEATPAVEPALRGVSPLERALRSLMRERSEGQT